MSIKLENVHFPNVVDVVCFRSFPEINTEIKRDMKYEKCYFSEMTVLLRFLAIIILHHKNEKYSICTFKYSCNKFNRISKKIVK